MQSAAPSAPSTPAPDVFSRSLRGPSDAELLRQNPFRKYDEPIDFGPLAPSASQSRPSSSQGSSRSGGSSSQSSTSTVRPSTQRSAPVVPNDARFKSRSKEVSKYERVVLPLAELFPLDEQEAEYSVEELMALKRGVRSKERGVEQQRYPRAEWMVEAIKSRGASAVCAGRADDAEPFRVDARGGPSPPPRMTLTL